MSKRDDIPSMRRRTSTGKFTAFFSKNKNNASVTQSDSDNSLKNSHKKSDRSYLKIVKSPKSRRSLTIVIVSVFLVTVMTAMFIISLFSPVSFVESTENFFAGIGASGDFPVELSVSARNDIRNVGNDILLLTDSNINLYTSGGGRIFSRQHGYSNPKSVCSQTRILTFDTGSTSYRVDNRSETVINSTTNGAILCAAISYNGTYALNTYSAQYICETTVYSNKGEARFRWNSAEQHITTIALSNDGKQIAIGSVGAKNGEYISTVRIFNINSTEAVMVQEFSNQLILSVSYNDNGSWGAVFEDSYVTVFDDRDPVLLNYNEGNLNALDVNNKDYDLLVLSNYNDKNKNRIVVVDPNGNIVKDTVFEDDVVSCSISDDYVFLLSKGKVTRMDIEGEDSVETEVSSDCIFALPCGRNVVTVNSTYLTKSSF